MSAVRRRVWLGAAGIVSVVGLVVLWMTRPVGYLISENPSYTIVTIHSELAITGTVLVLLFLGALAVVVLRPVRSIHPLVPTIPLALTLLLLLGIQLYA